MKHKFNSLKEALQFLYDQYRLLNHKVDKLSKPQIDEWGRAEGAFL